LKPVAVWARPFDDPILLPGGREIVTLRDTADYIMKLSKVEQDLEEWQAAVEALLLVVELGGPTMMARIGIMRALNRHVERAFNPDRKDKHLGETEDQAGRMSQLSDCRLSPPGFVLACHRVGSLRHTPLQSNRSRSCRRGVRILGSCRQ